jgi:hypothetical protein
MNLIDRISNVEQGTIEWFLLRSGVLTASRMDKVCSPVKMQYATTGADTLINQLMAEVFLPGAPEMVGAFTSRAMENGTETESEAREYLGFITELNIQEVGFIKSECGRFGCSPDGLIVNKDGEYVGGLELKCPLPHTHIGYMRYPADLLKKYKIQVHASLLVSGLKNWKLMSYFPGLDPVIIDVVPDETTDKLRDVLEIFWKNWNTAKQLLEEKGIDFNPVRKPQPEPQYGISEDEATEDLGFEGV